MPKLWIVHRNPQSRVALAQIAGLGADDIISGAPRESDFVEAPDPAALLLGLEGDFELELEFAHRLGSRLQACHWILLAAPEDVAEAIRLFAPPRPEILEPLPSARILRGRIAEAFARRRTESLAERRTRHRFSTWFGSVEVPGLLRSLDPSLSGRPLLVRGVPGSGRALLARYVELFRRSAAASPMSGCHSAATPPLRIHARDVEGAADLERQIAARSAAAGPAATTIWIDEVDSLSVSAQNALAEWIAHEAPPEPAGHNAPRWLASAGPGGWRDQLEPALARAFEPLVIELPSLAERPEMLERFAAEVAKDWSDSVGGPPQQLSKAALAQLAAYPWQGDRSEVESVLRASFASTSRDPIEAEDLHLGLLRGEAVAAAAEDEPIAVVEAVEEETHTVTVALPEPSAIHSETTSEPAARKPQETPEVTHPDQKSPDESRLASEASVEPPGSDSLAAEQGWRRLARSLSHEIRNPLVSIRSFAELLPDHYDDETFRQRFVELVGRDVSHISNVISQMLSVAEHEKVQTEAIDVSALIEELLDERRERIGQGRLLVLRELERDAPLAWAEAGPLRVALAGLLDRTLDSLPERGDLFVATRRIARGNDGKPRLRILLRHHSPDLGHGGASELDELSPTANVLEYALAETVVRSSGGSLTIDSSDSQELLILIDLRTPS
jgi:DNA-binding NtrC family response regulator